MQAVGDTLSDPPIGSGFCVTPILSRLGSRNSSPQDHPCSLENAETLCVFTYLTAPLQSFSPASPAPMAAPQAPKMPQFGAPPIPRNSPNGGWIGGYAKEGFQGVDILRQVAPPPAPASIIRPNIPPTLNPASPGASFGIRPVAVNGLTPGYSNGPVASPGLNPGFASRPVAVNGFNMAAVSSQPVIRPNLVQSPPPPPPVKSGGSLAEQLAARAGSLKSSNAPAPPPPGKFFLTMFLQPHTSSAGPVVSRIRCRC
jgi:hypothetical protein